MRAGGPSVWPLVKYERRSRRDVLIVVTYVEGPDDVRDSEYHREITLAYIGEVETAEVMELLMPRIGREKAVRDCLAAIVRLERKTASVLRPLVVRYDPEALSITLPESSSSLSTIGSWRLLVERLCRSLPPYVERYDRLAAAARPQDRAALSFLSWHERALAGFFQAELQGDGESNIHMLDWAVRDHHSGEKQRTI